MDNYWYYTLSAIPQTLAAMIALTATFFAFRLNLTSEKIKKNREDLMRFTLLLAPNKQGEIDNIERKTEEGFFNLYEQVLNEIKPGEQNLGLNIVTYEKVKHEMDRIIKEDWRSYYGAGEERISKYLYAKKDILKNLLNIKKMGKSLFGWSLSLTTLMIIISLSTLPSHDIFYCPRLIMGIILFGSAISIILTACSVWKIATAR